MSSYAFSTKAMVSRAFAADGPSSAPCKIDLLGSLIPGWEIRQPIAVNIQRDEDGNIIVGDYVFYLYGVANSLSDAIRDYTAVLTEYYRHLEHADGADRVMFEYLRTYLRPLDA